MTAGPDCVPLERLMSAELPSSDATHLAACARCQTERALARAFEASDPTSDEGAAVEWIVRETRRRVFADEPRADAPSRPGWLAWSRWATWASAAVAAGLGVYLLVGAPGAPSTSVEPGPEYRTTAVALVAPVGEVSEQPTELRWQPLAGAVQYAVSVREVDGTEIWRATTSGTTAALPDEVRVAAKPARTLTWRVAATDATGNPVGEASSASFRLRP